MSIYVQFPFVHFLSVANTKHLPQGVFPDKTGKFPDGSDAEDEDDESAVSAILYKLAQKNLDEIKGQKAQTGTKPVRRSFSQKYF